MIPWYSWHTIQLPLVTIQVWGLFVALGIAISIAILRVRAVRILMVSEEQVLRIAFFALIGGFLGARLMHVVFYEPAWYVAHPSYIFAVWQGGFSSFGGFCGAGCGAYLALFRSGLVSRWKQVLDEYLYAAVYGWTVGRVGCAMIHDHWGIPCSCPLAVRLPDGSARLDMAVLEIIGLLPILLFLWRYRAVRAVQGLVSGSILLYYGVLRFFLDMFRATDISGSDARYYGLTPAQYCAILICFCGIGLILHTRKGPH
jgi:phosphatidylglycerol---prolipoprotein diacylglyceryl transferase